mmetsp:Transcript_116523/g.370612  ORF Transcript_116523/g.370612 Transcript_116523/m.370612 type:complete len:441 (+) Transcript_116523:536-1858(+)
MVDGQHVSSLVLHALRVGGVPELVVVLETNKLVQEDLTGILVRVSAVRGSRGLFDASFAQSTGHAAGALRALVLVHIEVVAVGVDGPVRDALGWARARQGVPNGGSAIVLASAALPIGLVPAHVLRHGQGLHLATNDEAILVVNVLADRRRAATSVVGNESTELAFVRVPEFPSVLHSDLEALDAVDLVLAGSRHDDLVVQVPQCTGKVRSVDILQGIAGLALRAVHVEGLCARAGRRRRLRDNVRGGRRTCGRLLLDGLDVARLEAGAVRRPGLVEGVLELPEARGRGQALVPVRMAEDALGHGPMHRKVAGVTLLGVAALRHDGRELGEVLQVALEHRLSVVGAPPADAHQLQRAANEAEHRGGGQGLAQTREERAGEDASARLRNLHRVADTVVRLEVERLQEVGDLGHGCCGSRVGLCASCCDEAASLEAFDPELP